MRKLSFGMLAIGLLSGCSANSDQAQGDGTTQAPHSSHEMTSTGGGMTPTQQAFAEVNNRMHTAMAHIPSDADHAFMIGMLAHHRGAIEMAELELEHGKNEQARKLAGQIIAAQQSEIDEIEAWLADRDLPIN